MQNKGFTLIELLVVIGILAILTAAVVVVLNPAELLRQSRDAQRLSDFDAVRSAVSLYLSTALNPQMGSPTGVPTTSTVRTMVAVVGNLCNNLLGTGWATCTTNATTLIDSSGWVAVNFNELATTSVGLASPISALPTDPVNNSAYHYAGAFDYTNKYYELTSVLESTKYVPKMAVDGGTSTSTYELGNKLGQ